MKNAGNTDHYEGALLESIFDVVQGIAEGVTSLGERMNKVEACLERVEQQTELIPALVVSVDDHDMRLEKLENNY